MSAAVVGSFAWPALSTMSVVPLTMIRIAWYNSLVFSMGAIATSVQQNVFLFRVQSMPNSDDILLDVLSHVSSPTIRVPRWDQTIIWQSAVGLLEWSIYFWLGGYFVLLLDVALIFAGGQDAASRAVSMSV